MPDIYIHGTTSTTIASLAKTEYQLMPILMMLDQYQVAPMVGELTKGGYDILGTELTNDSFVGAICFGTLNSKHCYNLDSVVEGYTKFNPPPAQDCLAQFRHISKYSVPNAFCTFNLLLIYLTRAKQTHHSIDMVISKDEIATLRMQMRATVQFYYFIQLLEKFIQPDFAAIDKAGEKLKKQDLFNAVRTVLSMEHIMEKIIAHNLDVKAILDNPTTENLNKILLITELPKNCRVQSEFATIPEKEIQLPITQFFTIKQSNASWRPNWFSTKPADVIDTAIPEHFFHYMSRGFPNYSINILLSNMMRQHVSNDFLKKMAQQCKPHIAVLEDRIHLFEKLIYSWNDNKPRVLQKPFKFTKEFPIVLISQQSTKMQIFDYEYRCKAPLKLGEDIRVVATDNEAHRLEMQQFFCEQRLKPIQVILIDDLRVVAKEHTELPLSIDSPVLRKFLTVIDSQPHVHHFYKLYCLLENLNYKRNQFKQTHPNVYDALDRLLKKVESEMQKVEHITPQVIQRFCQQCTKHIKDSKPQLEHHRGVLGILDTALTFLASLIVFYPLVYFYQRAHQINYSIFRTNSVARADKVLFELAEIENLYRS